MIKLGLFFEVLGFIMMFWHSVGKPKLKFIPSDKTKQWIIDRFLGIAFLLMVIGAVLQIISLNQ